MRLPRRKRGAALNTATYALLGGGAGGRGEAIVFGQGARCGVEGAVLNSATHALLRDAPGGGAARQFRVEKRGVPARLHARFSAVREIPCRRARRIRANAVSPSKHAVQKGEGR